MISSIHEISIEYFTISLRELLSKKRSHPFLYLQSGVTLLDTGDTFVERSLQPCNLMLVWQPFWLPISLVVCGMMNSSVIADD